MFGGSRQKGIPPTTPPEDTTTSSGRARGTASRTLWLGLVLLILLGHFQPSLSSPTSSRSAPYETRTLAAAAPSWAAHLAAPSAAAAAARKARCRPSSRGSELLPGSSQLTYLEERSVSNPTLKDYHKKMRAFLEWAVQAGLDWTTISGLDHALVLYLDKLFFLGMAGDVASKTMAAVKFYYPEAGRYGDQSLPRASSALAGWPRDRVSRPQRSWSGWSTSLPPA